MTFKVEHQNFPGLITASCDHASECVSIYVPPPVPPKPDDTPQIVAGSVGSVIFVAIFIVLVFSIIYSRYQTTKVKWEYLDMMKYGNEFGAKLEIRNLTYIIRTKTSKKLNSLQNVNGVNEEDIAKEERDEERELALHLKSKNR